jgi:hypothetical protein
MNLSPRRTQDTTLATWTKNHFEVVHKKESNKRYMHLICMEELPGGRKEKTVEVRQSSLSEEKYFIRLTIPEQNDLTKAALSACFLGPKSGPVLINCPRILCVVVD